MIFAVDPHPQAAIKGIETRSIVGRQAGQELSAEGPKEPLLLAIAGVLVRVCMNHRDAEFGTHMSNVSHVVVGPDIDEEALGYCSA